MAGGEFVKNRFCVAPFDFSTQSLMAAAFFIRRGCRKFVCVTCIPYVREKKC